MASYDYDLFVIGAGSGGVRAARMAAGYGAKTAIAEESRVGGTCVIRGCVPKKLFVYASHYAGDFRDAASYGWKVGERSFDWGTLVANKDKEIDRLNRVYIDGLERAGVELFEERATLTGKNAISLGGREVTAKTILLAVGARPSVPSGVEGIEKAITSDEAFHLESLPQHVTVVGGGYIAVEFAGIFHGLGCEVTQLYRGEEILRGFDDDLRGGLREQMKMHGVDVRLNENPRRISGDAASGYEVELESGGKYETELVMYATGRKPNVAGLGLEAAGVETGRAGEVVVDEYSATTASGVYAVGDVTNRANLTPVAIREGAAFAETVFNGNPTAVDHSVIPTAVFSDPQLGTVGLTEAKARESYGSVEVYRSRFRPMKHTMTGRDEEIMMKMVVDGGTNKVLGVHLMGGDAGELIQALGIAVTLGATKEQFDATIAVHPTAAEELVTMKEQVA